jgi:hypothetical protein
MAVRHSCCLGHGGDDDDDDGEGDEIVHASNINVDNTETTVITTPDHISHRGITRFKPAVSDILQTTILAEPRNRARPPETPAAEATALLLPIL